MFPSHGLKVAWPFTEHSPSNTAAGFVSRSVGAALAGTAKAAAATAATSTARVMRFMRVPPCRQARRESEPYGRGFAVARSFTDEPLCRYYLRRGTPFGGE